MQNFSLIESFLDEKIGKGIFSNCSVAFGKPYDKSLSICKGKIGTQIERPINSETVYDLQSITKALVTAPLAVKLMLKNELDLDASISNYIPSLNDVNVELGNISLRQLLTHSGGMSDADLEGSFDSPYKLWTKMFEAKPRFPPGTEIEYSDLGYRIAGKVLEISAKKNLEVLSSENFWNPLGMQNTSFIPLDPFNTAATPDSHGRIDDEQVQLLGGVAGCDGLFSSANEIFQFLSALLIESEITDGIIQSIEASRAISKVNSNSFFDSLATGSKSLGWEINSQKYSYAGDFYSNRCLEKAGGAGTFIWIDCELKFIFVYLTNHGKPKPFTDSSWNELVKNIAPHELANLIYANI